MKEKKMFKPIKGFNHALGYSTSSKPYKKKTACEQRQSMETIKIPNKY